MEIKFRSTDTAVAASGTLVTNWVDLGADFKRLIIAGNTFNGVASVGSVLSLEESDDAVTSSAVPSAPGDGGDSRPSTYTPSGAASQTVKGRAGKRYVRAKFVNGATAQGATFRIELCLHVRR